VNERVEAVAKVLGEHRQGALTCYDHNTGWCCECGTHEILIPWREHAAHAVIRVINNQ